MRKKENKIEKRKGEKMKKQKEKEVTRYPIQLTEAQEKSLKESCKFSKEEKEFFRKIKEWEESPSLNGDLRLR